MGKTASSSGWKTTGPLNIAFSLSFNCSRWASIKNSCRVSYRIRHRCARVKSRRNLLLLCRLRARAWNIWGRLSVSRSGRPVRAGGQFGARPPLHIFALKKTSYIAQGFQSLLNFVLLFSRKWRGVIHPSYQELLEFFSKIIYQFLILPF